MCQFYKDEICILEYIMSALGIEIEDEVIKGVKNWLKLKLMRNI